MIEYNNNHMIDKHISFMMILRYKLSILIHYLCKIFNLLHLSILQLVGLLSNPKFIEPIAIDDLRPFYMVRAHCEIFLLSLDGDEFLKG